MKSNKEKLMKDLINIDKNIFINLIISNFDEKNLEKNFSKIVKENKSFMEKINTIIFKIKGGNFSLLQKIVDFNNEYVEKKYLNYSKEEFSKIFYKNDVYGINRKGIAPEQMLLYALSTGELKEYFKFFKEEYIKYSQKLSESRKEKIKKNKILSEILDESKSEKDFFLKIDNKYKSVKKRDIEKLEKKYKIVQNNGKFEVPVEFLTFFDEKMTEYFEMMKKLEDGFEFLERYSKKLEDIRENIEVGVEAIQEIERENIFLVNEFDKIEAENKKLKNDIAKFKHKGTEKVTQNQQKEIEKLYLEIEKLQEKIENMEQDEKNEVIENIKINEKDEKYFSLKNQNVKVIGGKWNIHTMEKAKKYAKSENFEIEFIDATEVFRNSDKLKNSDVIIFDTSYNSHSAFYKVKSYGLKIFRIPTSNWENIKKINDEN